MKTITLDVINQTAVSETAEGDVGVKLVVTNAPEEWEKCSVFALFTQGEQTRNELIKNPDGEYNVTTVPSAFTDANKAFKIGVYAVGTDASRDVRPSVWIRVMDTDFTTKDIIVTEQTLDDVLGIQALYTAYVESEKGREANEKARIEAENERVEAESQRKADISMMKQDISALQGEMKNKVDAEFGMGLSTNDFTDSDAMKLSDIEEGAQKNVQSDWNTSDTKSDAYIKNKPVVDQTYKSASSNAQSGKAVAEAIAKLLNGSPEALDTLYELAKALGNDPNFATTVMDLIGEKAIAKDSYHIVALLSYPGPGFAFKGVDSTGDGSGWTVELYDQKDIDNLLNEKVDKIDGYGLVNVSKLDDKIVIGSSNVAYLFYDAAAVDDLLIKKVDTTEHKRFKNDLSQGNFEVFKAIYANTAQDATNAMNDWDGNDIQQTYAKIRPDVITDIPDTFSPNQTYHLYEVPSSIVFPSVDVSDGDTIYITFMTGDTPPTISIDMKNTTDIDIEIEANTGYEIYGKYFEHIGKWIVGYSEYTVPGGEAI